MLWISSNFVTSDKKETWDREMGFARQLSSSSNDSARWELCMVGAALPTNSCGSGLKWSIQSGVTKSKKDKEINSIEMRKPSCSEQTDMRQFGALIGK